MSRGWQGAMAFLVAVFLATGCTELTQVVGELAGQQAYGEAYKKEYRKAKERGLGDAEADAVARQAAEGQSSRRRELVAGAGDVASSLGEVDWETERLIGETLALEGFRRYGLPVKDADLQRYVNLVGSAVARNSQRPEVPYRFVVVQSPLHNAFACPGGVIFVSSALVRSLGDEAELAAVLAHEVGHVGHKHALKSLRRARFLEGAGRVTAASMKGSQGQQFKSLIGDLQGVLFDRGLDKDMEFEADQAAIETAYRTGYDPAGLVRVLEALERQEATATKDGSWFSTHPPLAARLERTRAAAAALADAGTLAKVPNRFLANRGRIP